MNSKTYQILQTLSKSDVLCTEIVEDQNTGKRYVAKTLYLNQACAQMVHQFKREIEVLSVLNDPYVPQLIHVISNQDQITLVETWIDGLSLKEYRHCHPIRFMLYRTRWIMELMHLLENLHGHGFLYIDIKAENILIFQEHLFLIDFNACMPKGHRQAYMASASNQAPELFTKKKKEVYTDIYALGTLIQTFYKFSLLQFWVKKCMKKKTEQRFQTIRSSRIHFRVMRFIQLGIRMLLFICLSVFIVYPIPMFKEPEDLMQAYRMTMDQKSGSLQDKAQQSLHEWIIQKRLNPSNLESLSVAKFFMEQALLTQNTEILRFMSQQIPDSTQKKLGLSMYVVRLLGEKKPEEKEIHTMFMLCQKEDSKLNQAHHLVMMEQLFLEKEILLEQPDRKLLFQIHEMWDHRIVQENTSLFLKLACIHTEYLLFLKSKGIHDLTINSIFSSEFETVREFQSLYTLYTQGEM